MAKGKGKAIENPQQEGHEHGQETGHARDQAKPTFADKLQSEVHELKLTIQKMTKVDDLIKATFTGQGTHDEKVSRIIGGLYDMGLSDEEVSYLAEQKPGRDGNGYMGYPLQEMYKAKNSLRAKQLQLDHLEKRGTHVAQVEQRRENNEDLGKHL